MFNDSELDGQALTLQSVNTAGTIGKVTINSDNSVTYSPDGKFNQLRATEEALDIFRYTINDGAGGTATATVTIHVGGVNDSPISQNDGYTLAQRSTLTTTDPDGTRTPTVLNDNGVLANDTDADRDVLTATLLVEPLHASQFHFESQRHVHLLPRRHDGHVGFVHLSSGRWQWRGRDVDRDADHHSTSAIGLAKPVEQSGRE